MLGGALFQAVAWIFAVWADRGLRHVLVKHARVDRAVGLVLARIIRLAILTLTAIAVIEELGVEVASLIAALGIFGFAIAIGLRTTSTNFFTGVMLFVLKPYQVGDHIDGERVEGVVESMSLFHTVVIASDGSMPPCRTRRCGASAIICSRKGGMEAARPHTRGYWRFGEFNYPDHDYGDD